MSAPRMDPVTASRLEIVCSLRAAGGRRRSPSARSSRRWGAVGAVLHQFAVGPRSALTVAVAVGVGLAVAVGRRWRVTWRWWVVGLAVGGRPGGPGRGWLAWRWRSAGRWWSPAVLEGSGGRPGVGDRRGSGGRRGAGGRPGGSGRLAWHGGLPGGWRPARRCAVCQAVGGEGRSRGIGPAVGARAVGWELAVGGLAVGDRPGGRDRPALPVGRALLVRPGSRCRPVTLAVDLAPGQPRSRPGCVGKNMRIIFNKASLTTAARTMPAGPRLATTCPRIYLKLLDKSRGAWS